VAPAHIDAIARTLAPLRAEIATARR
jgi:hypothetical protein